MARKLIEKTDYRVQAAIDHYVNILLVECLAERGDFMADSIQRLSATLHGCYEVSRLGDSLAGNWSLFYRKYFASIEAYAVLNGSIQKKKLANEHIIPMNLLCHELRDRFKRKTTVSRNAICNFVERFCMVCIITDDERQKVDLMFRHRMPEVPWDWESDPWARYRHPSVKIFQDIRFIGDQADNPWRDLHPDNFADFPPPCGL